MQYWLRAVWRMCCCMLCRCWQGQESSGPLCASWQLHGIFTAAWHVHDSPVCDSAVYGHVMGKGGKVRRVLANRQSAQRSRIRKLQHISELEATLEALQHDIYKLSPQLTKLEAKQTGGFTQHGLPRQQKKNTYMLQPKHA